MINEYGYPNTTNVSAAAPCRTLKIFNTDKMSFETVLYAFVILFWVF